MTVTDPDLLERRLTVLRAAIAEAGGNPDAVRVNEGRLIWRRSMMDRDMAWRAWELSRQATGGVPRCRACFDACEHAADKAAVLLNCRAPRMFVLDCGTDR